MKTILITSFLSLSILTGFAQQTIELNNWKFATGDNLKWAKPGFDDSDWKTIYAGEPWEAQGYKDYNGYAWYRIKFNLPSRLKNEAYFKDSLLVVLGHIGDCDQVFVNGMLLGQNNKLITPEKAASVEDLSKTKTAWDLMRNYLLPTNDPRLRWNQENILAIRVFDGGSYFGGGGMTCLPIDIRMKDVADYIVFDMNSKIVESKSDGTISKTITIKNLSPLPEIKGKLTMEINNSENNKTVAHQTWNLDLKREVEAFTIQFKGDLSVPMKATYTFTASRTSKKTGTWYFPCMRSGGLPLKETPISFTKVTVKDAFWTPWIELNRDKIIPHLFFCCEKEGRMRNFARAAGLIKGGYEGEKSFDDEDPYKTIEASAYSLQLYPDAKLESYIDSVINLIAAAQQPDGYLSTWFILHGINKRWSNDESETYNAGHLFEAAVAWYQATAKRNLLDVAIKLADHIERIFGPGKRPMTPETPEIEIGLVKLYRVTNETRYLKLAQYFINQRGNHEGRTPWGTIWGPIWSLDDKPVRELNKAQGHAIRALYLYCGMADVAIATGDKSLIAPLDKVWDDMISSKTYITGGAGIIFPAESFGKPYQLPNELATAEGCSGVSSMFFAYRMTQLHADAKYMDAAERVLYNRVAAETSLDGQNFFYGSPLEAHSPKGFFPGGEPLIIDKNEKFVHTLDRDIYRSTWNLTPCCPPNQSRFLPTIGGYIYGQSANTIFVNLYVGGTANLQHAETNIKLEQTGNYPWDGNVKIAISPEQATKFDLALRVPSWCEGITFKVNGKAASEKMDKGYARIARTWQPGDVVEIDMPMPVKRVYADPRVEADRGRVALQRGPIVYCLEGIDHEGKVLDIMLPKDAKLTPEKRPDLLGGVTVITGTGKRVRDGKPAENVKITAIPFYAWDNRQPSGEMVVWLPEDATVVGK